MRYCRGAKTPELKVDLYEESSESCGVNVGGAGSRLSRVFIIGVCLYMAYINNHG